MSNDRDHGDVPGPAPTDAVAASRAQFGANAANYATSTVHAKGASLGRIVELIEPQPGWHALDIATAAGHTAFAIAERVASVVASDVTPEMLAVAGNVAEERGITNVTFEPADAHELGFADASFDLVTCRIAPHHFADPTAFVQEAARVLRPGGVFGLVDNLAPEDQEAARWCDDFERRRDRSHVRCLPLSEWLILLDQARFDDVEVETIGKEMKFVPWANNMSVDVETRIELLNDLTLVNGAARAWLRPDLDGEAEDASFVLTEGLFVARKPD